MTDNPSWNPLPRIVVSNGGEPRFVTLATDRQGFTKLLQREQPDVVVFETCTAAGWLAELCEELAFDCLVANPNGEARRWSRIERKTDRDDALKLLRMTQRHEGRPCTFRRERTWKKCQAPFLAENEHVRLERIAEIGVWMGREVNVHR